MITSFSEGSGSESDNDKPSGEETKNSVGTSSKQDQPLVVSLFQLNYYIFILIFTV